MPSENISLMDDRQVFEKKQRPFVVGVRRSIGIVERADTTRVLGLLPQKKNGQALREYQKGGKNEGRGGSFSAGKTRRRGGGVFAARRRGGGPMLVRGGKKRPC